MHERLLAIHVFVVRHRRQHDRRVRVVWHRDDHGVELVPVLGKRLAVIGALESVRVLLGGGLEGVGIHVAQTGNLRARMPGDIAAVPCAGGADDADREHAEFAILGKGAGARKAERGCAEAGGGCGKEEVATRQVGFHGGGW